MKLQRLAGYGPIAAFVSPAALLVFAFLGQVGIPVAQGNTTLLIILVIVFFVMVELWVAALTVVVFDLEWMEHPATSTPWFLVARISTLVALVMPPILLVATATNASPLFPVSNLLLYGAVGLSLLIHNVDARRAGILRGPLPWLGGFTGIGYMLGGVGALSLYFTAALIMGPYYLIQLSQLLYLIWAIWLGIHLTRSKAVTAAAAPAQ